MFVQLSGVDLFIIIVLSYMYFVKCAFTTKSFNLNPLFYRDAVTLPPGSFRHMVFCQTIFNLICVIIIILLTFILTGNKSLLFPFKNIIVIQQTVVI